MKTLKASSKRAQNWIKAYWRSNNFTLEDCYKTHSVAKHNAYVYCKSLQCNEGGWGFKIISHNTMKFTAAWATSDGSALRVETANGSYKIITDLPF